MQNLDKFNNLMKNLFENNSLNTYNLLEKLALIFSPSDETISYTHALRNFTKAIFKYRNLQYSDVSKPINEESINLEEWKTKSKSELELKLKDKRFMHSFLNYNSTSNIVGESDDLEDYVIKIGDNLKNEYDLTKKIFDLFYPQLKVLYPVSLKNINGKDSLFLKEVLTCFEDNYDVPSDLRKTLNIFETLISNSQDLIKQIDWWNTEKIYQEFKLIYAKGVLDVILKMQNIFENNPSSLNLPIFHYSIFEIPKHLVLDLIMAPRTIAHGDLNLGNIISTERNHFLIDYTKMAYAHPLYDVSYFLEQEELGLTENSKKQLINYFLGKSVLKKSSDAYDKISIITNQKIAKRYEKFGNKFLSDIHKKKSQQYINKLEKRLRDH